MPVVAGFADIVLVPSVGSTVRPLPLTIDAAAARRVSLGALRNVVLLRMALAELPALAGVVAAFVAGSLVPLAVGTAFSLPLILLFAYPSAAVVNGVAAAPGAGRRDLAPVGRPDRACARVVRCSDCAPPPVDGRCSPQSSARAWPSSTPQSSTWRCRASARNCDATMAGLQWIVTGYTVSLAGLILLGGALGDRYGRRRVFLIGVVWFGIASLLCALAPTIGTLIAARVLQGVGGALLTPGSLALIQASFHPDDRARAIGAWSGLGGVASATRSLPGRLAHRRPAAGAGRS